MIAVLERGARSEHPGAVARGAPRERDRAQRELLRAIRDPRVRERAALGAEGIRGHDVHAARDVVGVDLVHELRIAVERGGRPEREPRRDAAPLELGAGRAVEDQRRARAQPGFERRSGERHAPILARPMPAAPVLAVFCDFDGTFARQDVGSTLAARYAADRRPAQWARYERGEITAWEYNLEILEGLPVGLDVLEEFLATVELDPGRAACSRGARSDRFRSGSSPTASTGTWTGCRP